MLPDLKLVNDNLIHLCSKKVALYLLNRQTFFLFFLVYIHLFVDFSCFYITGKSVKHSRLIDYMCQYIISYKCRFYYNLDL